MGATWLRLPWHYVADADELRNVPLCATLCPTQGYCQPGYEGATRAGKAGSVKRKTRRAKARAKGAGLWEAWSEGILRAALERIARHRKRFGDEVDPDCGENVAVYAGVVAMGEWAARLASEASRQKKREKREEMRRRDAAKAEEARVDWRLHHEMQRTRDRHQWDAYVRKLEDTLPRDGEE